MSDSRMPQQLPQAAEQVLAPESLSVLTSEQLAFIEGKITELSGKFQVIDEKDATIANKESCNAQIAGIINDILSNTGLSEVEYKIFTDLQKLNSKNVKIAIKQLKLPQVIEGEEVNQDEQGQKEAQLNAIKEQLTEIRQEGQPMGWKARGVLILAGGVAALGVVVGGGVSIQNNLAQVDQQGKVTAEMIKGNVEITNAQVLKFQNSKTLIATDLDQLKAIVGGDLTYSDSVSQTVVLTDAQMQKIDLKLLQQYLASEGTGKFTDPKYSLINQFFQASAKLPY